MALGNRKRDRSCRNCHNKPALCSFRGVVKRRPHHDLCFRCFRSEGQRQRARELR